MSPERTVYRLTTDDIEKQIGETLTQAGAGEKLKVTLFADRARPLAEAYQPVTSTIRDIAFDKAANKFTARVFFQSEGVNLTPVAAQGRYEEVTDLPVLNKRVSSGDKIEKADITLVAYPVSRIRKDMVTDESDMLGKTPKQIITANRPIRKNEIESQNAVKKGASVTIKYQTGTMYVSTLGEAVEPGAVGDVIRVRNIASKAIVQGTVESANVISVSPVQIP